MKKFLALVLATCPVPLIATTLPRLELQELFDDSEIVALVAIESAQIIRADGTKCGIVYTARVVDGIKGKYKGSSTISYSSSTLERIGDERLLFLKKMGRT